MKISSTFESNNLAIINANGREGLYLPFSMEMMVCLDTPNSSANLSCEYPNSCLNFAR